MDKLLTVSVAAYNGAATLQRALDSCITPNSDRLEVWIIDDGSTDQTAAIAERYVSRYPELFHLYRQANGGYGSTIEAALQRAKGKYFRTLDCDDWFEAGALENLLPYLASSCSDIVYTNYKTVQDDATLQTYPVCNGMDPDAQYTFEDLRGTDLCMEMHGMTFRTESHIPDCRTCAGVGRKFRKRATADLASPGCGAAWHRNMLATAMLVGSVENPQRL